MQFSDSFIGGLKGCKCCFVEVLCVEGEEEGKGRYTSRSS